MTHLIEKLAWDTEFFSVPIGRIETSSLDDETVAAVLKDARESGLRCLYFEADPGDRVTVHAVEKNDFHLVDIRIVLEYSFENPLVPATQHPNSSEFIIDEAQESDMPRLVEIAKMIGKLSRYAFDDKFATSEIDRLYRTWINNSMHGMADIVLVARRAHEDSDAVGLITCLMQGELGLIDLVGVHDANHRKGIGTSLVHSALDWARKQKMDCMQVVTQGRNVPAQRLYQRMGFVTTSTTLYYHKWL